MSGGGETWVLDAHQRVEREASPAQLVAAAQMSALLEVRGAPAGQIRLRTRGVIGAMVVDGLRVIVRPRHLSRPVTLGLVLAGRDLRAVTAPGERQDDPDLLRVLALHLLDEAGRLFQRGLRREYEERLTQPDPLRGTIDLDRWRGPRSPEDGARPWCRVRDRSLDLPEHRLLHAALRRLARAEVLEPPLRRRADALTARLEEVPATPPPRAAWPRLRRDGLFRAYGLSIDLAQAVLEGLGEGEGEAGVGFLLDLDRLYERWLAAELRALAPEGWRVEAQEPRRIASEGLQRYLDVAIYDERGALVAILDAKNKGLDQGEPDRDDVHQIITYMATLSCPLGALVGVQKDGAPPSSATTLRGRVGRLHVVRLPGRGSMDELRAGLRAWAPTLGPAWQGRAAATPGADQNTLYQIT